LTLKSMPTLEFHSAAAVFPLSSAKELAELVGSMTTIGFDPTHPIQLFEGKILDGRNRYLAARKANVAPLFAEWNDGNPFEFAWRENATRRQIDVGTKATCYVKMRKASAAWETDNQARRAAANKRRGDRQRGVPKAVASERRVSRDTRRSEADRDRARTEEAKAAGASEATMGRALALEASRPDLFERVTTREITLNEALRLKRRDEVARALRELPSEKFRIIYADPPWEYGNKDIGEGLSYGPAAGHYPPMSMAALTALDVGALAARDAVLFLWVTSPMLPQGLELMKAWGFEYKASFVWNKLSHNFGHYNSVRHEFLLLGTRGSCLPNKKTLDPSVVDLKRSKVHSAKPPEFRAMIDSMYPKGKRIELFACGALPKSWRAWGAEPGEANGRTGGERC